MENTHWPGPMAGWLAPVVAAGLAAVVALAANRLVVGRGRRAAVAVVVPLIEETAKTGSALLLGAPILWTHALFGVIEAVYDATKPTRSGLLAGLVGLAGHLAFGLSAFLGYRWTGSGPAAIGVSTLAHVVFNAIVVGGRMPAGR